DFSFGIAVDASFNAYLTGQTNTTGIATSGAFQTILGGSSDAVVAKLNPLGSALLYLTYLGGSGFDFGNGIAVDGSGNAYVTGQTGSSDFPVTAGVFQMGFGGSVDAFVTKVNPSGSGLVYSTFLGGSSNDAGTGIGVDGSGNAFVTGLTLSSNFPAGNAPSGACAGTCGTGASFDAFVTEVNSMGSRLVYSTYLGGSGFDEGTGIALDFLAAPDAYVVGFTGSSTDFPTTMGAVQTTFGGGSTDAFVAKISEAVVPPPPSVGKVTGGGTVDVTGGIANFGFIVQAQSSSGPIGGDLQYVNHASGAKIHSVTFSTFTLSGNTATFSGACTNNGAPCTFNVTVQDNDQPPGPDSFVISIDGGSPEGGTLSDGDIEIHNQ
ncbi:MAG TPA: SBBP repeat-containing protein, partial [Rugosimonospora sp.]|nr:SBBP repeat-containing protein [Rugosimonospora sp.]